MAELSKKEFAALCNTTEGIITTNLSRGKLVWQNKFFDTTDPLNKMFFEKYRLKNLEEKKKQSTVQQRKEDIEVMYNEVVEKATTKVVETKQTKEKEVAKKESHAKSQRTVDWNDRKLKAEVRLKEKQGEKAELELEKLAGKLIPLDLAFDIIRIHNREIFATFQNDVENLAGVFCDILASGDRKKLAELTSKLNTALDVCVKRAEDVALASIRNAVEDYQEVRNRGERK